MTLTTKIMKAIEGTAYIAGPGITAVSLLADYHTARAVKAALRRKTDLTRLSGVREALNKYRVTAWLNPAGRIELRRDRQAVLTI